MDGHVCLTHMARAFINIGIDRDGLDTHLLAGLYYPDGYLAPVGYQYFFKHFCLLSILS